MAGMDGLKLYDRIRLILHSALSTGEKMILVSINQHLNKHGFCWPSYKTISRDTALGKRWITKTVAKLRRDGILTTRFRMRPNGTRSSLEFSINWSELSALSAPSLSALSAPSTPPEGALSAPLNCNEENNGHFDLEPYLQVWRDRYRGEPQRGLRSQLKRHFPTLVQLHSKETVLKHWQNYTTAKDTSWAKVPDFVETFGNWCVLPIRTAKH